MSPTSNTLGDPSNCKFNGREPQVYEVKSIAVCLQMSEPWRERPTGKRRFESEVPTVVSKFTHSLQH